MFQGDKNDFFARPGADVMMQAHDLDTGDLPDHRFHNWPRGLDQMGAYLFEQVASFIGRHGLDQVLLRGGQDALESDHQKIPEQVDVNVLGAPAHVFLFKVADAFANGRFNLALCFHKKLEYAIISSGRPGLTDWDKKKVSIDLLGTPNNPL